jgi:hypothetical protein
MRIARNDTNGAGKRVSGIQSTVLEKYEGVTVKSIDATLGDDVYGTARASPHSAESALLTT